MNSGHISRKSKRITLDRTPLSNPTKPTQPIQTAPPSRGEAASSNSSNQRVRLKAELDRAQEQIALLEEEIRIKDARMARIPASHRPRYPPCERMAILELRAARGWSLKWTASTFQITETTIANWLKRLDEDGSQALVQLRSPVNRFPDYVAYVVQRLKTLCPNMGKVKIAEVLARAGLHLGTRHDNRGPDAARASQNL